MKDALTRHRESRKATTKNILANAQKTLAAAQAQEARIAASLDALHAAYPGLKAQPEPQEQPAPADKAKQAETNTRRHLSALVAPKPTVRQRLAALLRRH